MSDPPSAGSRAREEAAGWFARLSRLSVTTEALREFRDWKRRPANAAAYEKVEAAWSKAGRLAEDPDIRAASAAVLARRPARRDPAPSRQRLLWSLGGLAAAAAVVAAALPWPLLRPHAYDTRIGEQRLIVLEDGSRVRLNTDSRLEVAFRGGERRVRLTRGEAYFDVAHDAARPFVVTAGPARVQAIGTRFDVWRRPDDVRVALLAGRVQVRHGASGVAAMLAPGQQLTATRQGLSPTQPADPDQVQAWTSGQLIFKSTPLPAAIAEINRYSARKVVLGAPDLAAKPVSGVFDTGDTAGFVGAVDALFGLRRDDRGSEIRLIRPVGSSS